MSANNNSWTNNTTATSAIRPRNNRRLISVGDGSPEDVLSESLGVSSSSQPHSSTNSPATSRGASPHPSRGGAGSAIGTSGHRLNGSRGMGRLGSEDTSTSRNLFTSDLWDTSWSSIQGFASSVLRNDAVIGGPRKETRANGALRGQKRDRNSLLPSFQWSYNKPSGSEAQWGPSAASKQVGSGTAEERRAKVQTKKREALLSADQEVPGSTFSRLKRKGSDERLSSSVPPEARDQEALVYVHHVQPDDTMAGVAIKYCCPLVVFRKVNRFWPHDRIQTKKMALLPVEACGVKGRPVDGPRQEDAHIFGDDNVMGKELTPSQPHLPESTSDLESTRQHLDSLSVTSSSAVNGSAQEGEPLWKHESWVSIDGFPSPVEIGRISSQALGFFPAARRKSNAFSDRDTPSVSLDLPRLTGAASPPASSLSGSHSQLKSAATGHRTRSSSGSNFIQHLQGPGGVGTLGRDVHSPGPAQDKLNKMFAAHLPNMAPKSSLDPMSFGSSFSTSNSSAGGTGLENVGGAIEGWMRKMASRAATIIENPPSNTSTGGGMAVHGDLIDMRDSFELEEMGEEERAIGGRGWKDHNNSKGKRKANASARLDQDTLLRERFPPRGRTGGEDYWKNKCD